MQERVEQLGGQFEVRSTPGQGTTVTTIVPL
jgi:signal transduction histidine kinase